MLYESFKGSPERPAAGNTCVSMTKMRILGQKSRQNDRFQAEFSKFFRKLQDGLYGCFMMYFGVLELWEAALNDPGMILNEFQKLQKIIIFLKNFGQNDDLDANMNLSTMNRFGHS